jgi:hypothetical protein
VVLAGRVHLPVIAHAGQEGEATSIPLLYARPGSPDISSGPLTVKNQSRNLG